MKKINEEIQNLIVKLREEGKTISEIAETTKVSESSCGRIIRENNVEMSGNVEDKEIKKLAKGVDLNDPQLQLLFNLNRIAKQSGTNLREFLQKVEFNYSEMLKITNRPHEFYLFLMDLCSTIFEINFEKPKIIDKINKLVDRGIFVFDVEDKIKVIEQKHEKVKTKCKTLIEVYNRKKTELNIKLKKIAERIQHTAYLNKGQNDRSITDEQMIKIAQVIIDNIAKNEVK